jgi:hypothetical protein
MTCNFNQIWHLGKYLNTYGIYLSFSHEEQNSTKKTITEINGIIQQRFYWKFN